MTSDSTTARISLMRRLRTSAKRPAYAVVERLWLSLLSVAGWLLRPRIAVASFTGTDRVVVIAPHPDDEMLGCVRAMLLHAAAGDRVLVVAVTDGRASRAMGLTPAQMARRRSAEFEAAIAEYGVEGRQLGLRENEWSEPRLVARLVEQLAEVRPTIVYAPSVVDDHAEHRRVARALAAALGSVGPTLDVRAYQVKVPLTPILANLGVLPGDPRIAASIEESVARATAHYTTQAPNLARMTRLAGQTAALWRAQGVTEVFWSMPAAAYASAMSSGQPARFRGIRDRPVGDGLAWLLGLRARRRLARAATVRQRNDTVYNSPNS